MNARMSPLPSGTSSGRSRRLKREPHAIDLLLEIAGSIILAIKSVSGMEEMSLSRTTAVVLQRTLLGSIKYPAL